MCKANTTAIRLSAGYPPDMQKLATETVLKQAEMLANELANAAGTAMP